MPYVRDPDALERDLRAVFDKIQSLPDLSSLRLNYVGKSAPQCPWIAEALPPKPEEGNRLGTINACWIVGQAAHTPDELAFILGHEVGHLVLGHSARYVRDVEKILEEVKAAHPREMRFVTLDLLGGPVSPRSSAIEGVLRAEFRPRVQKLLHKNELDADSYAANLMVRLGLDPNAGVQAMGNIEKLYEQLKPSEQRARLFSHPPAAIRAQEILLRLQLPPLP